MGKRLNVLQISQKEFVLVDNLSERMRDAIGEIEDTFTMIIYGDSGNGKTNLTVQVLEELASLGDMLYISWEEGHGKTIKDLIIRHDLVKKLPKLKFSDGETFSELVEYLSKKQSPKVIVLDTWQYAGFTYNQYKELKDRFVFGKKISKRKIIIIISHVKGKEPDGTSAIQVKRDCNIKIHVKGYMAIIVSRFGSKKNYSIWDEGAKAFWGDNYERLLNKEPISEKKTRKAKPKKTKEKPARETSTKVQVLPPAEKPLFKEPV